MGGDILRIAGVDLDVCERAEFRQRRQDFITGHARLAAAAVAGEIHAVATAAVQSARGDHQTQTRQLWCRHCNLLNEYASSGDVFL